MGKECGNRLCDSTDTSGSSVYCGSDCRSVELKAVWRDRAIETFGELYTESRSCICGDTLVQWENEAALTYMKRDACSRSCSATWKANATADDKAARVDRHIKLAMLKLRDNTSSLETVRMKKGSLGDYWDKWSYKSKLIHNALTGSRLC